MDGTREPHFEAAFLEHAERMAGMQREWAEKVKARLHYMEREKGPDSYLALGLLHITRETEAEALDLGGWPLMGALASYASDMDPEKAHEFRMLMQRAAAYGPLVDDLVQQARDLLSD